jgi:hypothetical protein
VLHNTTQERLAMDKHSSLFCPLKVVKKMKCYDYRPRDRIYNVVHILHRLQCVELARVLHYTTL